MLSYITYIVREDVLMEGTGIALPTVGTWTSALQCKLRKFLRHFWLFSCKFSLNVNQQVVFTVPGTRNSSPSGQKCVKTITSLRYCTPEKMRTQFTSDLYLTKGWE